MVTAGVVIWLALAATIVKCMHINKRENDDE